MKLYASYDFTGEGTRVVWTKLKSSCVPNYTDSSKIFQSNIKGNIKCYLYKILNVLESLGIAITVLVLFQPNEQVKPLTHHGAHSHLQFFCFSMQPPSLTCLSRARGSSRATFSGYHLLVVLFVSSVHECYINITQYLVLDPSFQSSSTHSGTMKAYNGGLIN